MAPYVLGLVIFIAIAVTGGLMWWNPHIEFHKAPASKKDMSRDEVFAHLQNHTILHLGGMHFTGLTLLAEAVSQSSDVAGMRHQEGSDRRKAHWVSDISNDGIFLQSVYPKFGLDHKQFFFRKWISKYAKKIFPQSMVEKSNWMMLRDGIGRFALHPDHRVNERSSLVEPRAQVHLFSEWALFWDLGKKVLLEKSHSNLVASPFLHSLWGLDRTSSPARFLFLQRHPLALGLSTIRRAGRVVDDLSLEDIIANWLAGEERRVEDWRNYFEKYSIGKDAYRVMQFEEILADPRKALTELFEWMGVPAEDSALRFIQGKVSKDANETHFGLYCDHLVHGDHRVIDEHHRLVQRFRSRVLAVSSYDLAKVPQVCREVLLGETSASVPQNERPEVEAKLAEEEAAEAAMDDKKR